MKNNHKENGSLQNLYKKYQKAFRIPENLNYYSHEDFKKAERKFLKYCFLNGAVEVFDSDHPVLR